MLDYIAGIVALLFPTIGYDFDKCAHLLFSLTQNAALILFRNIKDGESRALDNIGRSHARIGNFEKAIERYVLGSL